MGTCFSRELPVEPVKTPRFQRIRDNFETVEEVSEALRKGGLEACQLIVGIDFTKSNTFTGSATFGGRCLHDITGPPNPYLTVLSLIARTLQNFDDDNLIPCYGFGDVTSGGDAVFSFLPENAPAKGLPELLLTYRRIVPLVNLSGPTSFGPIIRQAMRDVYNSGMQFTVLLIIADGQITPTCMGDTVSAIVDASLFPLSIVMIGVGDGPWETMAAFDDQLPQRRWDNFQFVQYSKHFQNPNMTEKQKEATFSVNALMEIPEQYKFAEQLIGKQAVPGVTHIIRAIHPSILMPPPFQLVSEHSTHFGY